MRGDYWVLKYADNLARMEPRNVGILLQTSSGVSARFLGEREDRSLDLRTVRSTVTHTGAYKQWVEYWRYAIQKGATADESVKLVLGSLKGNYLASEKASVALPDVSLSEAVSFLFHSLVTDFPAPRMEEINLTAQVNDIIRDYRLRESPYFQSDPVVPCELPNGFTEHVRPTFGWVNGRAVYFQKVSINANRIDSAQKEVHNAAWIFDRLQQSLPSAEKKALVKVTAEDNTPTEERQQAAEYVTLLGRLSMVVYVDDPIAVHETFAPLAG